MKHLQIICLLTCILLVVSCKTKDKVVIINDNEYIDVTDYGISNNTSRDQTKAIQKLLLKNRKNGKFFFPEGDYHVSSLNIYEGIEIVGEEDTWFVKAKNCEKFSRMFNTIKYMYSGRGDSKTIKFSNINIDGNFRNQGNYDKYELEHQAMIFLMADKAQSGRLKVEIDNCNFTDGVADAISVYCNVDAKITNCSMTDVFRGGITVTGGHTKVYANNIDIGGSIHRSGIDIEIDGIGYKGSKATEIEYSNMTIEGDFDVSAIEGGVSKFDSITVTTFPYNFYAAKGTIEVSNSSFVSSGLTSAKMYFPANVKFDNCNFTIVDSDMEGDLGAFYVYWNTSYRSSKDLKLNFNNCKFINTVKDPTRVVKGISVLPDDYSKGNILTMQDCEFIGDFDYNIFMKQGGKVDLKNVAFDGKKGLRLNSVVGKSKYRYSANLDNVIMKKDSSKVLFYSDHNANQISLKNTKLDKSNASGKKRFGKTKIVNSHN